MSAPDALIAALAGEYRIVRELGAGGMATVFLAEDLRHGRQVAIKVVRDEVAASVGGSRFLREIQIAARLQHSHILPLLDSGEASGVLYYVMPYVAGESLRQRLDREGELPIPDALRLITQVVDALACAHGHGVVHRDIKADNVLLAGRNAMVMDFGIAKAMRDAATSGSGGATGHTMTQVGMAMGTPAYMAPEQAAADPSMDHRVDLYAVGVLAYEILTGHLPFSATSPQALLAAHLTQTPDAVTQHRPTVPAALEIAVMRCLEKRPADRWQTADELLSALELIASTASGGVPAARSAPIGGGRRWGMSGGVAAGVVMAAGVVWYGLRPKAPEAIVIGKSMQFTNVPELEIHPAVSPDGKLVAFAAGTAHSMRIFIRPVAGGRTLSLSDDTTAIEYFPAWSPDATRLAFVHNGSVAVAPSLGGDARTIVSALPGRPITSVTWAPDGERVAFSRGDSLFVVPVTTGAPMLIGTAADVHSCQWAPRGSWIACASFNSTGQLPIGVFGNRAPSSIVVFPMAGGAAVTVVPNREQNIAPTWSADGSSLYFLSDRDGPRDVFAVRLAKDGRATAPPVRVTTGLNAMAISMAREVGRLVYNVYTARANIWRLPIPASGSVSAYRADALTTGNQAIEAMSVSRDGRWLVYDSNVQGNADIFRIPVEGGAVEQLTSEPWDEFAPSLSPDNVLVAYHSFRNGTRDIEVKAVQGTSPAIRATDTENAQESYPRWSPDGSRIAYTEQNATREVMVITRNPDGQFSAPVRLGEGSVSSWSPDSRFVYFRPFAAGTTGQDIDASDPRLTEVPATGGTARYLPVDSTYRRSQQLCVSADGRTVYVKAFSASNRTVILGVPMAGGPTRILVTFDDAARPSTRGDFACGPKHFFFTLDEMESDIFIADITTGR